MTEADRVWFTLDTAAKPVGPYTVEEIAGKNISGVPSSRSFPQHPLSDLLASAADLRLGSSRVCV